MSSSASASQTQHTSEIVLAELLEELANRVQAGDPAPVEEFLQLHPEQAERLRRLLPAAQVLAELEQSGQAVVPPTGDTDTVVPGTLGDFRIIREVGRGGMGVVYEAEQISLGRRVALKLLPFAAALDARQLQRFKNEARAAALLHHTNIVPVYAVGCERGVHYYTMQFIEGQTLAQAIAELRQPALQLQRSSFVPGHSSFFQAVARLGIQAAEALEHAHQQGLIHRDIKPSNLLLEGEPGLSANAIPQPGIRVWLTDFGLARIHQDTMGLTITGDVMGTLRYMSPEQALAKHGLVDHRTDVYALGATLYELLTLEPVFVGRDREELLRQIAFDEPRPLRRMNRAAPVELDTILGKALAKHPDERYASAAELAEDFRRFLEHRPLTARRPSAVERLRKWARRRQGLVLASVAILVCAVVGLAISLVFITGERDEAKRQQDLAEQQRARAEARERTIRRYVLDKDLQHAAHAFERKQFAQADELLVDHRDAPDERATFGWRYLWQQVHPDDIRFLTGHHGNVYHVSFSPDGMLLASAGEDGRVRLWRTTTGEPIGVIPAHDKDVNWVAFSPDGRHLASAGEDRSARVWALPGLQPLATFRHSSEVVAVEFSRDGKLLFSGADDGVLRVWDLASGEKVTSMAGTNRIEALAVAPDGRVVATAAHDGHVCLWDLRRQHALQSFYHPAYALGLAFAHHVPLVAASWADDQIRICNTGTGALQKEFPKPSASAGIAFSPDDRWIAGVGPLQSVWVWEATGGLLYHRFEAYHGRVWSVAFSPDGKSLAATFEDGCVGLWKNWQATVEREYRTFAASSGRVDGLVLSPSCRTLGVLGKDIAIHFWDLSGTNTFTISGYWPRTGHMVLSGDDHTFAMVDDAGVKIQVYKCPSGQPTIHMQSFSQKPFTYGLGLALSHDGGLLASSGHNHGIVRLWDAHQRPVGMPRLLQLRRTLRGPELDFGKEGPGPIEFSPDGSKLIWTSPKTLSVWDLAADRLAWKQEGLSYPSFSVRDDLLAIPVGGTTRVVDTQTWQLRTELLSPGREAKLVAFSPDGDSLAVCDMEGQVHLWDLQTSQELFTLPSHSGSTEILRFTPDGSALLTVGITPDKASAWLSTYWAPRVANAPPEEESR